MVDCISPLQTYTKNKGNFKLSEYSVYLLTDLVLTPYFNHLYEISQIIDFVKDDTSVMSHDIATETMVSENRILKDVYSKIKAFSLNEPYLPLSAIEYSVLENIVVFYRKVISDHKYALSTRMFDSSIIDAYIKSQEPTIELSETLLKTMKKQETLN